MITLSNSAYSNHSVVQHSIVLIEGSVSKQLVDFITVCNGTTGSHVNWPVVYKEFKVLVLLKSGINQISLNHGFYSKTVSYTFTMHQSPYSVQPLYIVSRDGNGNYQAPSGVDNSASAAIRKIGLGVALLQTFTAVNLRLMGLGANTFQMLIDEESGLPNCKIFKSKYTSEEMYAMVDRELWRNIARELMESSVFINRHNVKFIAFLACTRYNGDKWSSSWRHTDIIDATKGYIALGKWSD